MTQAITQHRLLRLRDRLSRAINAVDGGRHAWVTDILGEAHDLVVELLDAGDSLDELSLNLLRSWESWQIEAGQIAQAEQDSEAGELVMLQRIREALEHGATS